MSGPVTKSIVDSTAAFEDTLAHPRKGRYVLRLYVSGHTLHSTRAIENLNKLCESRLKDRYELTVLDLHQSPVNAQEGQVVAAPTLIKSLPLPLRRLVGDMSNTNRVLQALDIEP